MKKHFRLVIQSILAFGASLTPAFSQTLELPGGLVFGDTFQEIQRKSEGNNWNLEFDIHGLNLWTAPDEGITFYLCEDKLETIDEVFQHPEYEAFDFFVRTVFLLSPKYGDPDINVASLSIYSKWENNIVGATFRPSKEQQMTVQIRSFQNKMKVWSRKSDASVCETGPKQESK